MRFRQALFHQWLFDDDHVSACWKELFNVHMLSAQEKRVADSQPVSHHGSMEKAGCEASDLIFSSRSFESLCSMLSKEL